MSGARPFGATYRLQLHGEFPLDRARAIVAYLHDLGVTHLYASPVLQARAGSRHGYDVADPTRVSAELGGEAAWRALAEALHAAGMGLLLDVVPNHMGVGADNPYWMDVLRHGRGSRWAHWFDIDWEAPPPYTGKVMLPVLGDDVELLLARGELSVIEADGERWLAHGSLRWPLDPDASAEGSAAEVHARQHYALAHWRRASTEITYRRFFDVNDLVALRAEDARVFDETHARVLAWVKDGTLDGLRIDHVDGLRDPRGYLERLRAAVGSVPVFVEKILSGKERLREEWPVHGTTGYEFLNGLEDVFVSAEGFRAIERGYLAMTGRAGAEPAFRDEALRGKGEVLRGALRADVLRLARRFGGGDDRLADTLAECMVHLPVYRTYVDGRGPMHDDDRRWLSLATERLDAAAASRIGDAFDGAQNGDAAALDFATRFQQTSGPATAKGVEDTALYRYVPLVSRNEVGGGPEHALDDAVARFHATNAERQQTWPLNLLATNTHDTKRSADVRARLEALSEMPDEWLTAVERWRTMNAPHRASTSKGSAPDANDEYLLYQSVVGAWPMEGSRAAPGELAGLRDRLKAYMEKAMREAKRRTSWTDPDADYERGVAAFVDRLFAEDGAFVPSAGAFVDRIARPAMWTSLARVALHLTAPGTPDTYQGDELWNLALVDPDNRRPVDYALRTRCLAELDARDDASALLAELLAAPEDGRVKLWTVSRLLRARRAHRALFAGDYAPLAVRGERAEHVVAFTRRAGDEMAVVLAPRLTSALAGGAPPVGDVWGDTTLLLSPSSRAETLRCALSGTTPRVVPSRDGAVVSVADALRSFPVAVLLQAV